MDPVLRQSMLYGMVSEEAALDKSCHSEVWSIKRELVLSLIRQPLPLPGLQSPVHLSVSDSTDTSTVGTSHISQMFFKKKLNPSPTDASTREALNPSDKNTSYEPLSDGTRKDRPDAAAKWGYTPDAANWPSKSEHDPTKCPPDHPVHKLSAEKIEKMRKKGINPVLRAEMDEKMKNAEGKGFWMKLGLSSGAVR